LTENIPWTYATGHLGIEGEFATVDPGTGQLGMVSNASGRCRNTHWVPCCAQE
jgi:hypothetical protein